MKKRESEFRISFKIYFFKIVKFIKIAFFVFLVYCRNILDLFKKFWIYKNWESHLI